MKGIIANIVRGRTLSYLLAAGLTFAAAQTAQAGLTINSVQTKTEDWSKNSDWVDIANGDNKTGILTNNYTGTVTIGGNFSIGRKGSGAKGEYVQNKGAVNVGGNLIIGYESSLTANAVIAGGTMNVTGDIEVPKNAYCTPSLVVRGGNLNGKSKLYLRKGTMTVDSGTLIPAQ